MVSRKSTVVSRLGAAALGLLAVAITLSAQGQRRPLAASDIDLIAEFVRLEDSRIFEEPVLTTGLRADHPEVRRRAVVAVARIVNPASSQLLRPYRNDPDVEVRATIAFAAGQLKDPDSIAWLSEQLMGRDTPTAIARESAQALGKIRTPAARVALAQFLTNAADSPSNSTVVGEALLAIGRFTTREDITSIVRWTTSRDSEVRWRAAWALFRPRDPAALPHLMKLAQDSSADVRFWAVRGLTPSAASEAGIDPATVSARLREAVRDTDRRVRTEALRALLQFDDEASIGVVLAALDSPDTWMSSSAAEGLHRYKDRSEHVLPRLVTATAASQPTWVRAAALTSLAAVSPAAAADAAALLIRSPGTVARTIALQTLQKVGEPGQVKLEALAADPATKALVTPATPGTKPTPRPARTAAEYRQLVNRWVVPDYNGAAKPRAVLTTPRGEIELELYPGDAPLAVDYLFSLIESGAIVGTEFGRVVPDFVAQQRPIAGAATIRDEVNRQGLTRGNLSWASAGLDTGRPGYTFGMTPQPHNEGDFTSLGRVVRGMDAMDRLELGDAVTAARVIRP